MVQKGLIATEELPKIQPQITLNTVSLTGKVNSGLLSQASATGIFSTPANANYSGGGVYGANTKDLLLESNHTHSAIVQSFGNGQYHENRMPFEAIERWKRIS